MDIVCDNNGNPLLEQFSEEGFIDLTFKARLIETTPESHRLQLSASYAESLVGLQVVVTRGIRGGFDSDMNLIKAHVYRPAVRFIRSGAESDRLVAAMATLYGLPGPQSMSPERACTGIALHQDTVDMETEAIKIKLFGADSDEDDEEDYFESFFNLDLPAGFVFWNEKDQDYRSALLRGLSTVRQ